jgi:hypothetical protein
LFKCKIALLSAQDKKTNKNNVLHYWYMNLMKKKRKILIKKETYHSRNCEKDLHSFKTWFSGNYDICSRRSYIRSRSRNSNLRLRGAERNLYGSAAALLGIICGC